jgi:hypothetical protein
VKTYYEDEQGRFFFAETPLVHVESKVGLRGGGGNKNDQKCIGAFYEHRVCCVM